LDEAMPASKRRKLLSLVPRGHLFVPWSGRVARAARIWVQRLDLGAVPSGIGDCRHLVSALYGGARFLVTHDARFYEAMRQCAKILAPLRPVWLTDWEEQLYGDQGH
jgi:hypothetical protein